jgi:hypothetical protein
MPAAEQMTMPRRSQSLVLPRSFSWFDRERRRSFSSGGPASEGQGPSDSQQPAADAGGSLQRPSVAGSIGGLVRRPSIGGLVRRPSMGGAVSAAARPGTDDEVMTRRPSMMGALFTRVVRRNSVGAASSTHAAAAAAATAAHAAQQGVVRRNSVGAAGTHAAAAATAAHAATANANAVDAVVGAHTSKAATESSKAGTDVSKAGSLDGPKGGREELRQASGREHTADTPPTRTTSRGGGRVRNERERARRASAADDRPTPTGTPDSSPELHRPPPSPQHERRPSQVKGSRGGGAYERRPSKASHAKPDGEKTLHAKAPVRTNSSMSSSTRDGARRGSRREERV